MKTTLDDTHIRWIIRRDIPQVLWIEERSFENAWIEEEFLYCLRQRNCIGMVAEIGDSVVAYMIYEVHKQRLHLLNLCVHPDWLRSGTDEDAYMMQYRHKPAEWERE